jgi:hypothetical protein
VLLLLLRLRRQLLRLLMVRLLLLLPLLLIFTAVGLCARWLLQRELACFRSCIDCSRRRG